MKLNWSAYGEVEIEDAPDMDVVHRVQASGAQAKLFRWYPKQFIQDQLPNDYSIELLCFERNGFRRFTIAAPLDTFINRSALGGLAILNHSRDFPHEYRFSYRANFHFYQRVRQSREHFSRKFAYSRDLFVRPSQRLDDNQRNVMTVEIGQTADGQGKPWSIAELTRRGREAAKEHGVKNPVSRVAIEYGLIEAATRNPLELSADEVESVIRLALFDGAPEPCPSGAEYDEIVERILIGFEKHDTMGNAAFDDWFFGSHGGLTRQIANQKKRPFGQVSTSTVRAVLANLGWEAYRSVAHALHMQMWCFEAAMRPRLTAEEWAQYELTFTATPTFARLPLPLLAERLPMIEPLLNKLQGIDPHLVVPVIYRVLSYYGLMSRERREADRRRHSPKTVSSFASLD